MRRNMAQSLFQYGQIETTLTKAKDIRPFVERLITLARKDTLPSRQRILAMLGDRAMLDKEEQAQYEAMSDTRRHKVLRARSGRFHRDGRVPASYNKKKIPFVARSVVRNLIKEVAPRYRDRAGGYTRIIRLAKRRIGDNSDLVLLQLLGEEEKPAEHGKKTVGRRRQKTLDRIRYLEGKGSRRKGRGRGDKSARQGAKATSSSEAEEAKATPVAEDEPVNGKAQAEGATETARDAESPAEKDG